MSTMLNLQWNLRICSRYVAVTLVGLNEKTGMDCAVVREAVNWFVGYEQ